MLLRPSDAGLRSLVQAVVFSSGGLSPPFSPLCVGQQSSHQTRMPAVNSDLCLYYEVFWEGEWLAKTVAALSFRVL